MTYTIQITGYSTKTIKASNEAAARNIFALQSGWLSDEIGYKTFVDSLTIL